MNTCASAAWGRTDSAPSSCWVRPIGEARYTAWVALPVAGAEVCPAAALLLDRPVVIGRCQGVGVPYLDPCYRPTVIGPSGVTILSGTKDIDNAVSRAHFLLRSAGGGAIVLLNGVPAVNGGVRPPMNGTRLVEPEERDLLPGEEYRIEPGTSATICLPNGSRVEIEAK